MAARVSLPFGNCKLQGSSQELLDELEKQNPGASPAINDYWEYVADAKLHSAKHSFAIQCDYSDRVSDDDAQALLRKGYSLKRDQSHFGADNKGHAEYHAWFLAHRQDGGIQFCHATQKVEFDSNPDVPLADPFIEGSSKTFRNVLVGFILHTQNTDLLTDLQCRIQEGRSSWSREDMKEVDLFDQFFDIQWDERSDLNPQDLSDVVASLASSPGLMLPSTTAKLSFTTEHIIEGHDVRHSMAFITCGRDASGFYALQSCKATQNARFRQQMFEQHLAQAVPDYYASVRDDVDNSCVWWMKFFHFFMTQKWFDSYYEVEERSRQKAELTEGAKKMKQREVAARNCLPGYIAEQVLATNRRPFGRNAIDQM